MNPSDTQSRHAIPSYPIRRRTWDNPERTERDGAIVPGKAAATWRPNLLLRLLGAINAVAVRKPRAAFLELIFLVRSFAVVRTLDIFVISGGGQLLDSWGGPWDYPFTIFKWVMLARLSGTKCYFINVGAGPLRHSLSRILVKRALYSADYVSFRDQKSKLLLQELGYKGEAEVFPDCVYGLDVPLTNATPQYTGNEPVVGMSPMAYCDPRRYWIQDQGAYEAFVRKLVLFGSWLCERNRLTLFSTDIWFDSQTLAKVDEALKDQAHSDITHLLTHEPIMAVETLLSHMSSMDYIITCRFHGVVFAHLMNIPVIALSHHPKVKTLMADLGLSEYCLDIDTFDQDLLTTTFARMMAAKGSIKSRMVDKLAIYKSELARQFDQLFAPEVVQ